MRSNFACLISRGGSVFTAALMVAFLLPVVAVAQQDAKDAEIARLKELIEFQAKQQKLLEERSLKEIELLNKAIKDREAAIVKLELEKKTLRIEAVQHEATARTAARRNEDLVRLIRELETKLARILADEKVEPPVPQKAVAANPPPVFVKGKIEKIDGDLVQINLGSDHGVNKNNTLEVYRLTPEPKYLGMIRFVESSDTQSVGRLVVVGNATRPEVKVGDLVASKIEIKK